MDEKTYYMVRMTRTSGIPSFMTVTEVAVHCGIHPELIDRFLDLGLIDCAERDVGGEALFQVDVVPLIRRILRLRNELGVNYAGIGVILELMAKIESLEAQIRELEGD
jgi:DNA-binding transcriptional MerR regulator